MMRACSATTNIAFMSPGVNQDFLVTVNKTEVLYTAINDERAYYKYNNKHPGFLVTVKEW